jgi:predicted PurR-regulated permease PerM
MKTTESPASLVPLGNPSPTEAELPPPASLAGHHPALPILATIAVIFALNWAQGFFISLLLGILFAYTLNPLVVWLERLHIPRLLGAGIVLVGAVCALAGGAYSLRGQMQTVLEQLPIAATKLSTSLAGLRDDRAGTLRKVQAAASAIERATNQSTGGALAARQATRQVVVEVPGFKFGNFLWVGSMNAAGLIGQASMVLFLTFFLLLSGNTYRRKLVRLTGPSMSNRRVTVHMLDDINNSIQRYMLMLLVTNVLVGLLTWVALSLIGLENAGAWAVAAGLLHIIPYFGPAVAAAGIGMAAFIQFDALSIALLVALAPLVIATVVGVFVTTWMTGRIVRMNTAAIFVSLLFWTWLWGIWGMLLSMPITVILKVVTQHVEQLAPVADLLGD